jgi:hypothetical protein
VHVHGQRLLSSSISAKGERPMSVTVGPNGTPSFHRDPAATMDTIEKSEVAVRSRKRLYRVSARCKLECKMPEYPNSLIGWKTSSWWREWKTSAGGWLNQKAEMVSEWIERINDMNICKLAKLGPTTASIFYPFAVLQVSVFGGQCHLQVDHDRVCARDL